MISELRIYSIPCLKCRSISPYGWFNGLFQNMYLSEWIRQFKLLIEKLKPEKTTIKNLIHERSGCHRLVASIFF